jgi:hypothetical protein
LEAFSYGLHVDGLRLENHYTFRFSKGEFGQIRQRLGWSVHANNDAARIAVLPKQLRSCFRIHYATKPTCDGLYFDRITTARLIWFAKEHLPASLVHALSVNAKGFAHLYWDVGFDFTFPHDGNSSVDIRKFAIYGCV